MAFLWPDYYPNSCPPEGAFPAEGVVFRFTDEPEPRPGDFEPHVIKFPGKQFPDMCLASGLSVYRTLEDAQRKRRRVPGLRDKCIARGSLNNEAGLLMKTLKHGHHTWWVPRSVESPCSLFSCVAKPDAA